MYEDDYSGLGDALAGSDYYQSVGPTNAGTYNVPLSAQPANRQWDTGGGMLGQYGDEVLGILAQGIGAWSQYKRNDQFMDYQRYEATAGGVYQQGRPNPGYPPAASVGVSAGGTSPLMLILLIGGAILLLRK